MAYESKHLTKYYTNSDNVKKKGQGFALNLNSLKQWRLVLEELKTSLKVQQRAEADARAKAEWEAITAVQLISSSPSREPWKNTYDSEKKFQFGFAPIGYRRMRGEESQAALLTTQSALCGFSN